jgi:hypothetical protein
LDFSIRVHSRSLAVPFCSRLSRNDVTLISRIAPIPDLDHFGGVNEMILYAVTAVEAG